MPTCGLCLVSVQCVLTAVMAVSALGAAEPAQKPPVDYAIIVTGGELLAGAYPDAHTAFLTRTLRPLGLHCVGSITVDDRPADIKEALKFASARAPLVIVTGGLGPTANDVTRETLSEFTGIALREHPDVLAEMEKRFGTPRGQLRPNLRKQAQMPVRGTYLKSAGGTAAGLVFERDRGAIVALPGPPRELQPMVRSELVPYLSRRFGTRLPGASITMRFVGLGQSQIDHVLKEHVPQAATVTTGSQFEGSRVDFTFSLPDDTPQDRARLQDLKRSILEHLADNYYAEGETTLEEHVAGLLESRKQTVGIAEAGGGNLAAAMGSSESARRALAGAFAAPTVDKLRRLLRIPDGRWAAAKSESQRIEALAAAVAQSTGSSWGVAIGEPQPGKDGARSVVVAFRWPDGRVEGLSLPLRGVGELARSNLTTRVLDQLRRRLRPHSG